MLAFLWSAGQTLRTRSRSPKKNDISSAFARTAFVGAAFFELALLTPPDAIAQELPPTNKTQDFGATAREVFRDRCIECHGQEVQEGGLRLDHREGLIVGGDSGKAVDFGRSQDSLLLARIMARDETRMPPTGMPLNDAQIGAIRQWIDADGAWESGSLKDPRLDHWAWQSLQNPQVPSSSVTSQQDGNPIDRFLSVAMSAHGIKPLGSASRETLIRRLSFDVLGIPPTPEESDQFVEDRSPDAWERLVDRTLGSPHYGERWARHWLDIAHYADTHGFERDQRRDHAWRYRDWVIDAFNSDLPLSTFLQHQIAGDVLPDSDPDSTIASSFLAVGPWDFVGQVETPSPMIKRLARADDLDDMVAQVMTSMCGITIHCARCHHHKLDPIRQEEYYGITAIFAGVGRGDRTVSQKESEAIEAARKELKDRKQAIDLEMLGLSHGISLADIVGGGNGFGTGTEDSGIDPSTGALRDAKDKRGFLDGVETNRLNRTNNPWIDSVFVPDGGSLRSLKISQAGTLAESIPSTGGKVWDAIRNGPVNSQFSTSLDGIECMRPSRSMLSLHANAGITFTLRQDLIERELLQHRILPQKEPEVTTGPESKTAPKEPLVFTAMVGYFGQTPKRGADVYVLVDGQIVYQFKGLGREDGLQSIRHVLPQSDCLLTLIATDGGNGISHDQVCFIDASIAPLHRGESDEKSNRIETLRSDSATIQRELDSLPQARRVYGIVTQAPAEIRRLHRGDIQETREVVSPGAVACVGPSFASIATLDSQSTDAQRRIALAQWLTSADNPLPPRVMVNRLWHHHFGKGLVATPSDFGLGGAMPSHPELLDWLALELQHGQGSLKRLHRMILLSDAYQRHSFDAENPAASLDAGNRFLWRQNPRRLDAESLRDAILTVSDAMVATMHGPGYRDFEYKEEYAPVYRHLALDTPEVFRRSIYRFVVRTTPHPFLTSLDCPNPATLTPVRNTTTTAIQSLATLNNAFVLQQSDRFAARLIYEVGENAQAQAERAIRIAFSRRPTQEQIQSATRLIQEAGLFHLCRILLNTNEFIYVD